MISGGYNDVTPNNPIECCFAIGFMFITGMAWAFCLNSIGNIMNNINKISKDYEEDMRIIHEYMRNENIN